MKNAQAALSLYALYFYICLCFDALKWCVLSGSSWQFDWHL